MRPGGEIGRHKGLKILFAARRVWVRFPPRALSHPTANVNPSLSARRATFTNIFIFLAAACWFSLRASRAWISSGYMDPVGHFGPQDEAVYSRVVMEMLQGHHWLTPTFLGRLAFFKPPFLFWLSAMSVQLGGGTPCFLRLPSVLAAAGVCTIAWSWVGRERGIWAASLSAILILSDPYWIMLGSLNMMDAPLAFLSLAAIYVVARDPALDRRRSAWLCGILIGAAILTKSAAGLIPAAAILSHSALFRPPKPRRIAQASAAALLVAAPWFLYALLAHSRWFWNEHILTELVGNSTGATPLSTHDPNLFFYSGRLFRGDPVTAGFGLAALALALFSRRANSLVMLWLGWSCLALLLFRYHAASYLLPVVTGLALSAGFAIPDGSRIWAPAALVCAALSGGWFLGAGHAIQWSGTNVPSAPALERYCEERRGNTLFILQPDDEFYSGLLPLPRVQYGIIDPGMAPARLPIDWRYLGVIVTADQFARQPEWWPIFRARLSAMGLDDRLDPRGTEILFPDAAAARTAIREHPELDFFVPREFAAEQTAHTVRPGTADRVFLLAEPAKVSRVPGWTCEVGGSPASGRHR